MVNRKNSGMVLVRGTELGELYIEAGHIVHAKAGTALGDEAVLAMSDWDKGRVIFDWESTTDERTVRLPTEQVIERMLVSRFVEHNGMDFELSASFLKLMPQMTREEYRKHHRNKLEYMARLAQKQVSQILQAG